MFHMLTIILLPFLLFKMGKSEWLLVNGDPLEENKFSRVNTSAGVFSDYNRPGARYWPLIVQPTPTEVFSFGGIGYHLTGHYQGLSDLWCYNTELNQWAFLRGDLSNPRWWGDETRGPDPYSFNPINEPGGRAGGSMFNNPLLPHRLFLYGGLYLNSQLWEYDTRFNEYRLVHESSLMGSYSKEWNSTNLPAARYLPAHWAVKGDSIVILFGGRGNYGNMNDLVYFSISNTTYKWVHGGDSYDVQSEGEYGVRGVYSQLNEPPARHGASFWQHGDEFLYLFNGRYDIERFEHVFLNDLWAYSMELGQWKWINGERNFSFVPSTIVEVGSYHPDNTPGSRMDSYSWYLGNERAYFYGGDYFTHDPQSGYMIEWLFGDHWQFDMELEQWRCLLWCDNSSVLFINREYDPVFPEINYGRTAGESFKHHSGDVMMFGGYPEIADVWRWVDELQYCRGVSTLEPKWHCSGHGICENDICSCYEGFLGDDCELWQCYGIDKSNQSVCSGHGDCFDHDFCDCDYLYAGTYCSDWKCYGIEYHSENVCSSNGVCGGPNNCSCDLYFSGDSCQIWSCGGIISTDSSVCSGHGSCQKPENCSCQTGYFEEDCSSWTCGGVRMNSTEVCSSSSRGQCSTYNVCDCTSLYNGPICQYHYCFGISSNDLSSVCSGFGNCSSTDHCQCNDYDEHFGSECELTECFGIPSNSSAVCGGRGSCNQSSECVCDLETFPNIDPDSRECNCSVGWYSEDCTLSKCYGERGLTCNNNGNCTIFGSYDADRCECVEGVYGLSCEITSCFGIWANDTSRVCQGRGECFNFECICPPSPNIVNNSDCRCKEGAFGDICEITTCFDLLSNNSQVCQGRGECLNFECVCPEGDHFDSTKSDCSCIEGAFGHNCEITTCNGILANESNVCHSRGECVNFTCNCPQEGHYDPNHPTDCRCTAGSYGELCEISTCHGILANETSEVCSGGRGQCVNFSCVCPPGKHYDLAYDDCRCKAGAFGDGCNSTTCYGIKSTDINVCGGPTRGKCIDFECHCEDASVERIDPEKGDCSCLLGWYGAECDDSFCFETLPVGPIRGDERFDKFKIVECSGLGSCVAKGSVEEDFCECSEPNSGRRCEYTECFGISTRPTNDSSTTITELEREMPCSNRGECIDGKCYCWGNKFTQFENCSCHNGFWGNFCNASYCFSLRGFINNKNEKGLKKVECSGHGNCRFGESYKNDFCDCHKNWVGNDCAFPRDRSEEVFMSIFVSTCAFLIMVILAAFVIFLIVMGRYMAVLRQRNNAWNFNAIKPFGP